MTIKKAAEKEMKRMIAIFKDIKINDVDHAQEFYDFARNYFSDGKHFFEKEKYIESFEAFIIAWSYIDAGLKLNFFIVSKDLKPHFTID